MSPPLLRKISITKNNSKHYLFKKFLERIKLEPIEFTSKIFSNQMFKSVSDFLISKQFPTGTSLTEKIKPSDYGTE